MSNCPCCSTPFLRHIHHRQVYWFCRSCWQEMPLIDQQNPSRVLVLEPHFVETKTLLMA